MLLRKIADTIEQRISRASASRAKGPYDVELGFMGDKIILFQVRPFVENRKSLSSGYLKTLDPVVSKTQMLDLGAPWKSYTGK